MKKKFLSLFIVLLAIGSCYAQVDNIVAQPTHVIGRRIDVAGEVTLTLESDFSYSENGKPVRYDFPNFGLWTTYSYNGDFFSSEYTSHQGGHPVFGESLSYTYEEGRVKTISHTWEQMNADEHWEYDYYEDGRLKQKDYREGGEEYHQHYVYEYENEGRTVIESYWTSWMTQGLLLRKRITFQYDEEYRLLTALSESYSIEGELTHTMQTVYAYTPSGMEDSEITQTLTEGEWVNTSIQRYIYDDFDRVIEQQNGSWSQENGEWYITRRITFETSDNGQTYIVSFYKKDGDEWVWDMFNNQTILFQPYMKIQQRTLRYYTYEDMNGSGKINQFEFALQNMEKPVILDAEENSTAVCSVYPNPGNTSVMVSFPIEQGVIRFYDLNGKLMIAKLFNFRTEIATENWDSGIYVWTIWNGTQKEASGKWIKE